MEILIVLGIGIFAFLIWKLLWAPKVIYAKNHKEYMKEFERSRAEYAAYIANPNMYSEPDYVPVQPKIKSLAEVTAERAKDNTKDDIDKIRTESNDRSMDTTYGYIKNELICPHCQTKGKVRSKYIEKKIVTKKNVAIGGFALGGKDETKTMVTQFKCDNCSTAWEA